MSSTDIKYPSLRTRPRAPVTPHPSLCPQAAFDVVAIVASVGGFRAIRAILAALPADFPAALIFQMHLDPRRTSLLVDLLRPYTTLPVKWAAHGQPLRPGMVTVVPRGQHVRVSPWGLMTFIAQAHRYSTPVCCNILLSSIAASFKSRALGVVLTGYLDDGACGVRAIHQHGGRVLVQDPATAEAPGMPQAALRTGCADAVLPLAAIPAALIYLITNCYIRGGYDVTGRIPGPP